nr:MAG TPA: hypothetical protein [Caudoviricetes sp.]
MLLGLLPAIHNLKGGCITMHQKNQCFEKNCSNYTSQIGYQAI